MLHKSMVIVQIRNCTCERVEREIQFLETREICKDVGVVFALEMIVVEVEMFKTMSVRTMMDMDPSRLLFETSRLVKFTRFPMSFGSSPVRSLFETSNVSKFTS